MDLYVALSIRHPLLLTSCVALVQRPTAPVAAPMLQLRLRGEGALRSAAPTLRRVAAGYDLCVDHPTVLAGHGSTTRFQHSAQPPDPPGSVALDHQATLAPW